LRARVRAQNHDAAQNEHCQRDLGAGHWGSSGDLAQSSVAIILRCRKTTCPRGWVRIRATVGPSCRRANGWYSHARAMLRADDGGLRTANVAAEATQHEYGFEGT
jgi:hypothetical protein